MYLCFLTCIPFTQTCVLPGATLINQNPEKRRLLNYKALGEDQGVVLEKILVRLAAEITKPNFSDSPVLIRTNTEITSIYQTIAALFYTTFCQTNVNSGFLFMETKLPFPDWELGFVVYEKLFGLRF